MTHRLCLSLILLAAVVPHLWSVSGGFANDDALYVVQSEVIRSFSDALASFAGGYPTAGLYRPLLAVDYAVDHALMGLNPVVFHLHNLAWYAACCGCLYGLLLLVLPHSTALVAALLFALHPVHTEAVDSITGRPDLMGATLVFAGLWAFLRGIQGAGDRWFVLGLSAAFVGAFAKEFVVMLPGVFLAAALAFAPEVHKQKSVRVAVLGLGLVPLNLSIRHWATGGLSQDTPYFEGPWTERFWTMGNVVLEYVRLLFYPRTLAVDAYYQEAVVHLQGPSLSAMLGVGIVLGLVGFVLWGLTTPRWRQAWFWVAFFSIMMFPFMNIVPFGALMAERFLLVPSAVVAVALASAVGALPPPLRVVVLGLLVALGAGRTVQRSLDWGDPPQLWAQLSERRPTSTRFATVVAVQYQSTGELGLAQLYFDRAEAGNAPSVATANNLAQLAFAQDDLSGAQQWYETALGRDGDNPIAHNGLGSVMVELGRLASAHGHFSDALSADPNYVTAMKNRRRIEGPLQRAAQFRDQHLIRLQELSPQQRGTLSRACQVLEDEDCLHRVGLEE